MRTFDNITSFLGHFVEFWVVVLSSVAVFYTTQSRVERIACFKFHTLLPETLQTSRGS